MLQVPAGHVWVQGDNLAHSLDSRVYGPVPLALVKGRVVCQVCMDGWMDGCITPGSQGKACMRALRLMASVWGLLFDRPECGKPGVTGSVSCHLHLQAINSLQMRHVLRRRNTIRCRPVYTLAGMAVLQTHNEPCGQRVEMSGDLHIMAAHASM